MKALSILVVIGGGVVHYAANGQASDTLAAGSGVDFSGIYVSGVLISLDTFTGPDNYPLTAEGEQTHRAYDPLVQDPQIADDCVPDTVPIVLWARTPMQISHGDGAIEMRYERDNTVRTIYLDGTSPSAGQAHTSIGFSTGRWVGSELIIETTHIINGFLTNEGYPISADARLTERYWRNPGEMNLQLEFVAEDPTNYTDSVTLTREFVFSPEAQVRPWECVSLGDRDSEPDIDELARMLEEL